MKRLIKLLILIIISLSVYFIYQKTNNSSYTITNIGDKLSLGINSYGMKEYGYIDYYKDYLQNTKERVVINKEYANEKQTIKQIIKELEQSPKIKRVLTDTDILIITLGYNDLLEELSLTENISNSKLDKIIKEIEINYDNLIQEVKKYYHGEIIVIGYYESNKDDYYINKGIKKLNSILNKENITFINTYNLLKNRNNFFSNPNSYFPNNQGYNAIYKEIVRKSLAK